MDFDSEIFKIVYNFLFKGDEDLCRLCLSPTTDQKVKLDDKVSMERTYINDVLTYNRILEDLAVAHEPLLPSTLCMSCAITVANAYIFKHLIKYYNSNWCRILSNLQNATDLTKTISKSAKTVYIIMADHQNILLTSRNHSTNDKKKALIRIKKILQFKKKYDKIEKIPSDIICEECGEKCRSITHLKKHITKAHRQMIHSPCPKCPEILMSHALLESHMIRVHLPKKFKCPKCDKMFSTKGLLRYHDKHSHIPALCTFCFVQLPSKQALRSHMNKHETNECSRCGKIFNNRQYFMRHIKTCDNLEHKKFKFFCDLCNKSYMSKRTLRTHLQIDHEFGGYLHCCKYCDKKYDSACKLRNHMVVHTRERNYHCEECGNKFVTPAALLYHTRLHTGERPYKCDLCDESFISASRRMAHKHRKHLGPKQQCHICHSKFVLNNELKRHMKRHSNPQSKLYVAVKNK